MIRSWQQATCILFILYAHVPLHSPIPPCFIYGAFRSMLPSGGLGRSIVSLMSCTSSPETPPLFGRALPFASHSADYYTYNNVPCLSQEKANC